MALVPRVKRPGNGPRPSVTAASDTLASSDRRFRFHAHPALSAAAKRADRLLLPAGSSSSATPSCSCSPTSISIWIPAALLRADLVQVPWPRAGRDVGPAPRGVLTAQSASCPRSSPSTVLRRERVSASAGHQVCGKGTCSSSEAASARNPVAWWSPASARSARRVVEADEISDCCSGSRDGARPPLGTSSYLD